MHTIFVLMIVMPFVLCAIHAWLNRQPGIHPHRTPFIAGLYANLLFLPLGIAFLIRVFGLNPIEIVCGCALILFYLNSLVILNWFIFALTDVSMHIQLLMQIQRHGTVTPTSLVERYNKQTILGNRIPRLLELGQLREQDGRLFLSGRSVMVGATVCLVMRRILGIPLRPDQAHHDASI